MLALCPTMAVTSTATHGLGMGLATMAVLTISNLLISAVRHWVSPEVRIPVYIVFIATVGILEAVVDGLMIGFGFTLALVTIGAVREILGSGTLFTEAHLLLGEMFAFLEITLIPEYKGFLLMLLPPGGFLTLGFLLAGKRVLETRLSTIVTVPQPLSV
ncbi:electron transport complex, RnfABCDGE type, E subunit [Thioploca ingrica]|uniref:Electron transport complex, RnfABCDGE type, E subunit n=1 Tax=Thioploca ingrica TaxID=40754 RepID=A0A090ANB4_9GAMM|nr:electron transport complex, RnfABCDGE type, E subunit [Thioploca ingrica]